jgi:hypothetical protein
MTHRPILSDGYTKDQIKWKLIGNDGSTWSPGTHYIDTNAWWYTLTTVPVGWQFRNKYSRYTTCQTSKWAIELFSVTGRHGV